MYIDCIFICWVKRLGAQPLKWDNHQYHQKGQGLKFLYQEGYHFNLVHLLLGLPTLLREIRHHDIHKNHWFWLHYSYKICIGAAEKMPWCNRRINSTSEFNSSICKSYKLCCKEGWNFTIVCFYVNFFYYFRSIIEIHNKPCYDILTII